MNLVCVRNSYNIVICTLSLVAFAIRLKFSTVYRLVLLAIKTQVVIFLSLGLKDKDTTRWAASDICVHMCEGHIIFNLGK